MTATLDQRWAAAVAGGDHGGLDEQAPADRRSGSLGDLLERLPTEPVHPRDTMRYLAPLALCLAPAADDALEWRLCGLVLEEDSDRLGVVDAFPYGTPWDLGSTARPGGGPVVILPSVSEEQVAAALAHALLGVAPLEFLAGLRGAPVPVTRSAAGLAYPADAGIVIEAELQRASQPRTALLGRYGGYYLPTPLEHVAVARSAHWREPAQLEPRPFRPPPDPLTTAVADTLGLALATRLAGFPGLRGVRLPRAGCGFSAVVALDYLYPGQPRQLMQRVWGDTRFGWLKRLVVVDSQVDIDSDADVEWALATCAQPARDTLLPQGYPPVPGDPARLGDGKGLSARWGVDATRALYDYARDGNEHPGLCTDEDVVARVEEQWERYGLQWPRRPGDRSVQ